MSNHDLQHPLADPDLLHLVLLQSGIDFDYDVQKPNSDRANLRLLHTAAAKLLDGLCSSYTDVRRSGAKTLLIDPADVAKRAAAAIHRLGPLRKLHLEGLDDDALATILAAAGKASRRASIVDNRVHALETLCLPRGHFSGSCLYTCDPRLNDALPGRSPIVGDMGSSAARTRLLPRLLELDLGGCGQLTDAGLEALTSEAPLLAKLRLTVNSRLIKPKLSIPWLRSATLAICANLSDEAVEALCQGAPLLRELSLWRCSSLVSPRIKSPYLETLNLCECADLQDGALRSLPSLTRLSSLLLAGCDHLQGETAHWGGTQSLTTLDVSDMPTTSDAQLTAACAASPHLRRLDFSRSGPAVQSPVVGGPSLQQLLATRCEGLVDEAVSTACSRSPNLTTLMLGLCSSLHTPRIHGDKLSELNLSGCPLLSDSAVTHACEHSPNLSKLTLSLCAALNEPNVKGPRLKRVELSHAEKLSKPLVGGPSLEELSLSGCAHLEDTAVEYTCKNSPKLKKLSISGCTKLHDAVLESPNLNVLNCHSVAREVVDMAADRLRCPVLYQIRNDAYPGDADGFAEVD